jgi:hypothetical protein
MFATVTSANLRAENALAKIKLLQEIIREGVHFRVWTCQTVFQIPFVTPVSSRDGVAVFERIDTAVRALQS